MRRCPVDDRWPGSSPMATRRRYCRRMTATNDTGPKTCIIGAGCSGFTMAKRLQGRRAALRLLRDVRRHRRQLVLQQPERHVVVLPVAAHRHLEVAARVRGLPGAAATGRTSRTTRSCCSTSTTTSTTSGCVTRSRSTPRSRTVQPLPGGRWAVTLSTGETREYDALVVANGHHWDARTPTYPGTFDGYQVHSHHYSRSVRAPTTSAASR